MIVKLLTEHHLESLSLKRDCTGSPESTLVKMSHCWKSHVTAQIYYANVSINHFYMWLLFCICMDVTNGASAWDFQQFCVLTCVDSDEPLQPPFKLRNSKWCSVSSLTHRIFKWLAKALIRLHVCAGWSEALLVAHTTLLEISCHG